MLGTFFGFKRSWLQEKLIFDEKVLAAVSTSLPGTSTKAGRPRRGKAKWAQVILMLEQSLTNAERLMAIYSYSRPLRSDKARRAFVVRLKSDVRVR
ncbi:hypothetical protein ANCDUO_05507 [Ancylostoma duodenale]|uniref:Uncharacterized protein n=1 Tax=Ancylostoma duodenale TaxID=51022 RepID=A0A0C2GYI8_9BILA|nr:hypothetical protein ANCDUO_05507 [Ancylostoma duodenale]